MDNYNRIPLAERMRPKKLSEVIGQEHLVGRNGLLSVIARKQTPVNLVLWGPPGVGKTTIIRILQKSWGEDVDFIELSAVVAGIKDIKEVIRRSQQNKRLAQKTVLFVDELHRFNKIQQDAFLPHIEAGHLVLLGATTENPSFEINNALLSRMQVIVLKALDGNSIKQIIKKTLKAINRNMDKKAIELIVELTGGDARIAINTVEMSARLSTISKISAKSVKQALQRENYLFDKKGEEHYSLISALIKSMRGGDDEASMYYLFRLIKGGEDPLFIARRMVIFASEDIGMAAPYALTLAVAAFQAVERVGLPEAEYALSHAAVAMAESPKSRSVTDKMQKAKSQVSEHPNAKVPLHLRNATTKLMGDLGYGKDYKWLAGHKPKKGFMPEGLEA